MSGRRGRYPATVEEHLSPEQVAERLALSRATVFRLLRQGRDTAGTAGIWPVYRPNRKTIRIPASAVHRFLERNKVDHAA